MPTLIALLLALSPVPLQDAQPQTNAEETSLQARHRANVRNTYPINDARIYVTGLSMGGYGTWDLLSRYPDVGHNSWAQTYDDPELYKWLFAQKRLTKE